MKEAALSPVAFVTKQSFSLSSMRDTEHSFDVECVDKTLSSHNDAI